MNKLFNILKEKENFDELTNKRMDEIKDLSRKTDFNNLTYYFKENIAQKFLSVLKLH